MTHVGILTVMHTPIAHYVQDASGFQRHKSIEAPLSAYKAWALFTSLPKPMFTEPFASPHLQMIGANGLSGRM